MADDPEFSYSTEAALIKPKPRAIIIIPTAILKSEDASFPFFLHRNQKAPTAVANVIIQKEFTDWKTEAGTSQPKSTLSVFCSAYKFISPPACSNAAQKSIINKKDKSNTKTRSFSIWLSGLSRISLSFSLFLDIKFPTFLRYFCPHIYTNCPKNIPIAAKPKP